MVWGKINKRAKKTKKKRGNNNNNNKGKGTVSKFQLEGNSKRKSNKILLGTIDPSKGGDMVNVENK